MPASSHSRSPSDPGVYPHHHPSSRRAIGGGKHGESPHGDTLATHHTNRFYRYTSINTSSYPCPLSTNPPSFHTLSTRSSGYYRGINGVLLQSTIRTTHPNCAIVQSSGCGRVTSGDPTHLLNVLSTHTLSLPINTLPFVVIDYVSGYLGTGVGKWCKGIRG